MQGFTLTSRLLISDFFFFISAEKINSFFHLNTASHRLTLAMLHIAFFAELIQPY